MFVTEGGIIEQLGYTMSQASVPKNTFNTSQEKVVCKMYHCVCS